MGKFLQAEKIRQADFKSTSSYFSGAAKADGIYKNHSYPFCLPRDCADENLFPDIREPIKAYFSCKEIKWHDGQEDNPSNHLCDSQVCCANFLFPFFDKPIALAALFKPLYPDIDEMLPIEGDQYVAFECIGERDYLCEKKHANSKTRSRGANCTSADAAVMFCSKKGYKQIVLIEWKFTESYYPTSLVMSTSGTDRRNIYIDLYNAPDCPIAKEKVPSFDDLFFEPFYQFMRQQLLAHEMEKAHELCADRVTLLHISPAHNIDFFRITSANLESIGKSATHVWSNLVKQPGSFIAAYSEDLYCNFPIADFPELSHWWQYISHRYPWIFA